MRREFDSWTVSNPRLEWAEFPEAEKKLTKLLDIGEDRFKRVGFS